jgi:threonine dehydrogenase-like Zn-dependent dehydrogenase
VGPLVVPEHLDDEKVLFLTDILSTGWMAADQATVEPGDTIVVRERIF